MVPMFDWLRRGIALCTVAWIGTCGVVHATNATETNQLINQVLIASEVDASQLHGTHEQLSREIESIVKRFSSGKPGYRKAKNLHQYLHRRYFKSYDADADSLQGIMSDGRYNCLSSTLFYGVVAQRLGYTVDVLSLPGHLLLRLDLPRAPVNVETTVAHGFDVHARPRLTTGLSSERISASRFPSTRSEYMNGYWTVNLNDAVGFAWLNTAWRALEAGDAIRAAQSVSQAGQHLPDLAGRAEGAHRLLAKVFRQEYEAHRFEESYRIAHIDVAMFPQRTTSRDRLLAAALKLIESRSDADDPLSALRILEAVERACGDEPDLRRFERRTLPLIATAAVRLQDWALAWSVTEQYAGVEPDYVEAQRLKQWVEDRRAEALVPNPDPPVCVDSSL